MNHFNTLKQNLNINFSQLPKLTKTKQLANPYQSNTTTSSSQLSRIFLLNDRNKVTLTESSDQSEEDTQTSQQYDEEYDEGPQQTKIEQFTQKNPYPSRNSSHGSPRNPKDYPTTHHYSVKNISYNALADTNITSHNGYGSGNNNNQESSHVVTRLMTFDRQQYEPQLQINNDVSTNYRYTNRIQIYQQQQARQGNQLVSKDKRKSYIYIQEQQKHSESRQQGQESPPIQNKNKLEGANKNKHLEQTPQFSSQKKHQDNNRNRQTYIDTRNIDRDLNMHIGLKQGHVSGINISTNMQPAYKTIQYSTPNQNQSKYQQHQFHRYQYPPHNPSANNSGNNIHKPSQQYSKHLQNQKQFLSNYTSNKPGNVQLDPNVNMSYNVIGPSQSTANVSTEAIPKRSRQASKENSKYNSKEQQKQIQQIYGYNKQLKIKQRQKFSQSGIPSQIPFQSHVEIKKQSRNQQIEQQVAEEQATDNFLPTQNYNNSASISIARSTKPSSMNIQMHIDSISPSLSLIPGDRLQLTTYPHPTSSSNSNKNIPVLQQATKSRVIDPNTQLYSELRNSKIAYIGSKNIENKQESQAKDPANRGLGNIAMPSSNRGSFIDKIKEHTFCQSKVIDNSLLSHRNNHNNTSLNSSKQRNNPMVRPPTDSKTMDSHPKPKFQQQKQKQHNDYMRQQQHQIMGSNLCNKNKQQSNRQSIINKITINSNKNSNNNSKICNSFTAQQDVKQPGFMFSTPTTPVHRDQIVNANASNLIRNSIHENINDDPNIKIKHNDQINEATQTNSQPKKRNKIFKYSDNYLRSLENNNNHVNTKYQPNMISQNNQTEKKQSNNKIPMENHNKARHHYHDGCNHTSNGYQYDGGQTNRIDYATGLHTQCIILKSLSIIDKLTGPPHNINNYQNTHSDSIPHAAPQVSQSLAAEVMRKKQQKVDQVPECQSLHQKLLSQKKSLQTQSLDLSLDIDKMLAQLILDDLIEDDVSVKVRKFKIQAQRLMNKVRDIEKLEDKIAIERPMINQKFNYAYTSKAVDLRYTKYNAPVQTLQKCYQGLQSLCKKLHYIQIVQQRYKMWRLRLQSLSQKIKDIMIVSKSNKIKKISDLMQHITELQASRFYGLDKSISDRDDQIGIIGLIDRYNRFVQLQVKELNFTVETIKNQMLIQQ